MDLAFPLPWSAIRIMMSRITAAPAMMAMTKGIGKLSFGDSLGVESDLPESEEDWLEFDELLGVGAGAADPP